LQTTAASRGNPITLRTLTSLCKRIAHQVFAHALKPPPASY
jgi:hypothetical protein